MVEPFSLTSECVIAFTGFIIAIVTIRKDPKSITHRLLASSMFLIGVYGVSIVIYDIAAIEFLVHFLLRLSTIALLFGVIFLYFTFQVIVHTSSWLDRKLNTWPYLIGAIIYGIVFYAWWPGAVPKIELVPVVNSQVDISLVVILGVSILIFMLVTINTLYRFGVKPSEGEKRKKMTIALVGFLISLSALFVNIASNLVEEGGAMLDIAFFLILAGGMIVIAYGFIGPVRK
jgi:hypothetical protein